MKRRVLMGMMIVVATAVVSGASYAWWRSKQLNEFANTAWGVSDSTTVIIPPGSGPRSVANTLAVNGIVADADLAYRYVRREGLGPRLKAGEYEFVGKQTPGQVFAQIVEGRVKLHQFTIPEGLRADEILPIIAASDLALSLAKLRAHVSDQKFLLANGVPATSVEGFLFPDTYSFPMGATEREVIAAMIARALREYQRARTLDTKAFSVLEIATLASIVEKETGTPPERPHISCVFHNRIKRGMKLQTDPTVLYAKYLATGSFSRNITRRDLEFEHPYNTYAVSGLPPGPIANPGAAAITAAVAPSTCEDLFFVSRNDTTHVFCPTLRCHEDNVRKWQIDYFRHKEPSSSGTH